MRPWLPSLIAAALVLIGPARATLLAQASVRITEFMASNGRTLADADREFSDWIELHNDGDADVDLAGWSLTDDPAFPRRWVFPSTNLVAGGHLVVFASGKDRRVTGAQLHTDFSLAAGGEYLALFPPEDGPAASEFAPAYPPQQVDISYGERDGQRYYFPQPTPGTANVGGVGDFVADTRFSQDRGIYEAPFDLVISTTTEGARIRYTTNGAPPTLTTGSDYTGPIRISGTTVLRAAAFREGLQPSNIDTHTYLFPADIIRQSAGGQRPWDEWPAPTTSGNQDWDYGMDPDIVDSATYRDEIIPALKALPSFSLVTTVSNLVHPTTGIYQNPGQDGRAWERPCSVELIHPDGTRGFQVEAGLRIRGGFSRSGDNPKHAFRLFFRSVYGDAKLRYPLHEGGAEEFDNLDLRTFQNYSWSFQGDSRGVFVRDVFSRDTQLAMGQQGERGNYYHLYINGVYWGIFNSCERPEASFGETYFGGDSADYDVIKVEAGPYTINPTDGTLSAWSRLYNTVRAGVTNDAVYFRLQGRNPDGTPNPEHENLLDVDNLIDYMLVILYGGNLDAPISNFLGNTRPNNWYGLRNRTGEFGGFRFISHDAEHTLLDANANRIGPYSAGSTSISYSNPQYVFQQLWASPEFKIRLADRVYRHLFNGGALTPEAARARFARRTNELFTAVVAESARWGDAKTGNPLNRNSHWLPAVNTVMNSFLSGRTTVLLNQLRAAGLYPQVNPPTLNTFGGPVAPGFRITLAGSPGAQVYYTLNGVDPRDIGGAAYQGARIYSGPIPVDEPLTLKARTRVNGVWSALAEADFQVIRTFRELHITEIMYNAADGPGQPRPELDFLELKNVGTTELDLSGVSFTEGISYTFPVGTRLAPGAFLVLVEDAAAFSARHPDVTPFAQYTGQLANGGERVTLVHATGAAIHSVAWDDQAPWPTAADGLGFSLVPVDPNAGGDPDLAASWRASSAPGGSPGRDDPAPNLVGVVVNEVLAHTTAPAPDWVELHNPSDTDAAVGGWFLTDDRNEPAKYRIPAGTVIPAGGYRVFTAADFDVAGPGNVPFAFSSHGEEVFLHSADADGNLTGHVDGFRFPASANGVSFGRHTNSVGQVQFPPQATTTSGSVNSGPRIGPVVINEIHFAPLPGDVAFVELFNRSDVAVDLSNPEHPDLTWRLAGMGFDFPPGVTLPPGGFAVVTEGDPALFRQRYGIPSGVPVYGPSPGVLQRTGERLELLRPDNPDAVPDGNGGTTVVVPMIGEDAVSYSDRAPWPEASVFSGSALERRHPAVHADDPAAWRARDIQPSPGTDNDANRPPVVDAGPDASFTTLGFPLAVSLAGTASDDGQPSPPATLSHRWSQAGGPAGVVFADPTRPDTTAHLPGQGTFILRLTVTDGEREASDDVLLTAGRQTGAATLVPFGSTWRYFDQLQDLGTAWRQPAYNDAGWSTGPAPLGYGDAFIVTTINGGPAGNRNPTAWFRRSFSVANRASITALRIGLRRDDGGIVYLNGQEILRTAMPEGPVDFRTFASAVAGGADETTAVEADVDPSLLVDGDNVLAVEIHQVNATSSDLNMDLELTASVFPGNQPPTASAGPALTVTLPERAALTGGFTDDGLPLPPGSPAFSWTRVDGPGGVTFDSPAHRQTTATFSTPGEYVLRFTVDDGAAVASSVVTVTVLPGQAVEPPVLSAEPGNPVRLRFTAAAGRSYSVRYRTDLGTGDWIRLVDIPAGEERPVTVDDPTEDPYRFYQLITPAP